MPIERFPIDPIKRRQEWLDLRKPDVTASVVGALFGVEHPDKTPLKLYLMHSGVEFDDSDNPVKRRGRIMEPAVQAAVAEERPEWVLEKCNFYYRDPELRLGATPDFFIHGDPRGLGVLQAKTAAPHVYEHDWAGGEEVPQWVELQNRTEILLTDAAFGAVAVLKVHAFDLACSINEMPRHSGIEEKIIAAVRKFWDDVANHREPDPNYSEDVGLLKIIAPHETPGKSIDLSGDNELPALLDQHEEIMAKLEGYKTRKAEIETELKFKMRDASRVVGLPEWAITWKTALRREYTVPAKPIRTLRIHHRAESRKSNG